MQGIISIFTEEVFSAFDFKWSFTPSKVFCGSVDAKFPVLVQGEKEMREVGLSSTSCKFKGVLKRRPDNVLLRSKRAILLCNGFVTAEGDSFVVNIMGERYAAITGIMKDELFVPIMVKSPAGLSKVSNKFPGLVKIQVAQDWLEAELMEDVMSLQETVHEHWFDYYPISKEALLRCGNSRESIEPSGPALSELLKKNKSRDAEFLQKARSRRGK